MCGYLSGAPYWGPGLQPRHMPLLGIKPMTLWFPGPVLNPLSHTSQGWLNTLERLLGPNIQPRSCQLFQGGKGELGKK